MIGKMLSILRDDARQSLIGRDESTALKAVLILLVILGHNNIGFVSTERRYEASVALLSRT